jgi:hypothetical protein
MRKGIGVVSRRTRIVEYPRRLNDKGVAACLADGRQLLLASDYGDARIRHRRFDNRAPSCVCGFREF